MRDLDIRRKLKTDGRLHPEDPNTRIIEELGLCQGLARVDIAVVNGTIHGYEIKSDKDTLARLPGQIAIYSQVLDFVTLVTVPSHAHKVRELIPRWWGLWTAKSDSTGTVSFKELRIPRRNPKVSALQLVQLLWREEALQALAERNLASGMLSKSRREIWRRLASETTIEELAQVVRERIRSRDVSWRVAPPRA